MLVNELYPGILLEPINGYQFYFQKSKKSDLLRLRPAPDVIAEIFKARSFKSEPIMYLGSFKNGDKKGKVRTVIVNGTVAFVEGHDFRKFNPVFS